MKTRFFLRTAIAIGCSIACFTHRAEATSNYEYKAGEYVIVTAGRSPDGQYAIAAHGSGDLGYDNFHIYLMDARSGKKIGPLTEIKDILDTAGDAYHAKWSPDSGEVSITWRRDRHELVMIRYRIRDGHAIRISGPSKVDDFPR